MLYDVIVCRRKNKYIARVKNWPEVMAERTSREAAIDEVKAKLLDYLSDQVEVVQVEIPIQAKTGNPWLDKFGWFKGDPTFDDLQAEIAAYRQEIDQALGG